MLKQSTKVIPKLFLGIFVFVVAAFVFQNALVVSPAFATPAPVCGNGIQEHGEECDTADFGGLDCEPDYDGGDLACTSDCFIDYGQCYFNEPEPYCGDGTINDNESCDEGDLNGTPNHCNQSCSGITPSDPITIVAHKIVCENETYLPNWGEVGMPDITASTAADFVAASNEHCWLEPSWTYQYGFGDKNGTDGVDKLNGAHIGEADGTDSTGLCDSPWCGPNTFTGTNYNEWKTFGPTDSNGMTSVSVSSLEDTPLIWVRENLKEGYIPFTYPPQAATADNVSAEIYCGTDTLNYDNYDYIGNPQSGGTYYCVAFNAPEAEDPFCGDGNVNQEIEQCDDGNEINDDACSNSCLLNEQTGPVCGNEIVESGEQCDDGNTSNGDGCSAICQNEIVTELFCGDGVVNQESEQCDGLAGVGAHQECSLQCQLIDRTYCGDGALQTPNDEATGGPQNDGHEQCDGSSGVGANQSCTAQCVLQDNQTSGPTSTASSGGGGGGGGGGIISLSVFNEVTESVTVPTANVSWFTNLNSTCRALYDSTSHDGSAGGANFGYANSSNEAVAGGTFHTAVLVGLQSGTQYFWRPVCVSGAQEKLGQQLTIAMGENPSVLGFSQGTEAPADEVKVLGFEYLPDTGGDLTKYYVVSTAVFLMVMLLSSLGYVTALRRKP